MEERFSLQSGTNQETKQVDSNVTASLRNKKLTLERFCIKDGFKLENTNCITVLLRKYVLLLSVKQTSERKKRQTGSKEEEEKDEMIA